jgi:mannose-1-phosphate guanylyltransferase/mannose-6-phosphate isomerase
VILPSDHLISDVDGFLQAMNVALELAEEGGIVTFGVEPTRPETGFGYIEIGSGEGPAHRVASFKEKPGPEEALELIRDGLHLWNSGMFVGRADQILAEARELCPGILEVVRASLPASAGREVRLGAPFESVEAISFDYAIMEKTERARVVPLDVGWSDVGSYRSLLEVSELDASGNHISGNVAHADVTNSYVSASSRPVVIAGLDRVVVVETADAVLVVSIDRAQDVKELRERIDGG